MEAGRREPPPKNGTPYQGTRCGALLTPVKGPLLSASIWPRSPAKGALAQAWTPGFNVSLGQHTPKWVLFCKKAVLGGWLRLTGKARKDTGAEMLLGLQCVWGELGAQVRPPARGTCHPSWSRHVRGERTAWGQLLGAWAQLPRIPRIAVLLEEVGLKNTPPSN